MEQTSLAAYLHPEEESFGASFKLQHINSSSGALVHPFELTVVREDDQVLIQSMRGVSIKKSNTGQASINMQTVSPTSSTFPVVRSFQQKWMRESSVCWM